MSLEQEKRTNLPDLEIIGTGNIGEKARQLRKKTPFLKRIGFRVPPRVVLADGFWDNFLQRNGLGANLANVQVTPDIERKIRNGNLSADDFQKLTLFVSRIAPSPIVIRSSAESDARGTGIYKTIFTDSSIKFVLKAILEVLASYFTPDALAFRKDAKSKTGFGTILEPLVNQPNLNPTGGNVIAPLLSGYGYTSTSRSRGYINLVPGIGGGVDTKDGFEIDEAAIAKFNTLADLINYYRSAEIIDRNINPDLLPSFLKRPVANSSFLYGNIFLPKTEDRPNPEVLSSTFAVNDETYRTLLKTDLAPLFDKMQEMEEQFGKPQYFEFAITIEENKPVFWGTQIADVDKKVDAVDFGNHGHPIAETRYVTGNGIAICQDIVFCYTESDLKKLLEYNKTHKDYILIYYGWLISTTGPDIKLSYRYLSNAKVILEVTGRGHRVKPIDHFRGQGDLTGKFMGILDIESCQEILSNQKMEEASALRKYRYLQRPGESRFQRKT